MMMPHLGYHGSESWPPSEHMAAQHLDETVRKGGSGDRTDDQQCLALLQV